MSRAANLMVLIHMVGAPPLGRFLRCTTKLCPAPAALSPVKRAANLSSQDCACPQRAAGWPRPCPPSPCATASLVIPCLQFPAYQVFSQPVFAAVERTIRHRKGSMLASTRKWAFRLAFRSACEEQRRGGTRADGGGGGKGGSVQGQCAAPYGEYWLWRSGRAAWRQPL